MLPAEIVILDALKIVSNVTAPLQHLVASGDLAPEFCEPHGINADIEPSLVRFDEIARRLSPFQIVSHLIPQPHILIDLIHRLLFVVDDVFCGLQIVVDKQVERVLVQPLGAEILPDEIVDAEVLIRALLCDLHRPVIGTEERDIGHDLHRLLLTIEHVFRIVLLGELQLCASVVGVHAFDDLLDGIPLAQRLEANEALRADVPDLRVLAALVDDEAHLDHRVHELLSCDGTLDHNVYRRADAAAERGDALLLALPLAVAHALALRMLDDRKTVFAAEPVGDLADLRIGRVAVVVLQPVLPRNGVYDDVVVKPLLLRVKCVKKQAILKLPQG